MLQAVSDIVYTSTTADVVTEHLSFVFETFCSGIKAENTASRSHRNQKCNNLFESRYNTAAQAQEQSQKKEEKSLSE